MDRKEDLDATGGASGNLIVGDPRASDEIRRGRAVFLEEVERRNAPAGFGRPFARRRRQWLSLVAASALAAGAAAVSDPDAARDLSRSVRRVRGSWAPSSRRPTAAPFRSPSPREARSCSIPAGGSGCCRSKRDDARVLVEDGVVDATIAHRRARTTRWDFEVGPYRVTVNGTRFQMAFRAQDRVLRVSTEEGSVAVAGGCLEAAKTVSAGESLEASCPPREAPAPDELPATDAPRAPAQDLAPTAKATRTERWRELLAAGRLLEGLRAAERADFDQVCRSATAKELLALADAGRFFGPSQRAVTALVAIADSAFPGRRRPAPPRSRWGGSSSRNSRTTIEAAELVRDVSAGAAERTSDGRRVRPLDGGAAALRRRHRRPGHRRAIPA